MNQKNMTIKEFGDDWNNEILPKTSIQQVEGLPEKLIQMEQDSQSGQTQLSKGADAAGTGSSFVTDIDVNGHQVTLRKKQFSAEDVNIPKVTISTTPPQNAKIGDIWFQIT